MAAYIAKYVLGNSNLIAVIGLATVISMVIGLPFAGPLVARTPRWPVWCYPSNLWVFFVSIIGSTP